MADEEDPVQHPAAQLYRSGELKLAEPVPKRCALEEVDEGHDDLPTLVPGGAEEHKFMPMTTGFVTMQATFTPQKALTSRN